MCTGAAEKAPVDAPQGSGREAKGRAPETTSAAEPRAVRNGQRKRVELDTVNQTPRHIQSKL